MPELAEVEFYRKQWDAGRGAKVEAVELHAIAAADHLTLSAPVVIEADAAPNPGGWPRGGQTVVSFRNQHLSYAVTWFGLAIVLLGVWFSYNISKGRIGWI